MPGQKWYCHCGTKYNTTFGMVVEMIDHHQNPPVGWYMRADFPEQDIKDMKTLLRYDRLKREGVTVMDPVELLKRLPKVEPLAQGTLFVPYEPGNPDWEGHFDLVDKLKWESLPKFSWTDLYAQVAQGLNDPEWVNYSRKNQNKWKRERIEAAAREVAEFDRQRMDSVAQARKAVEEYEERHGFEKGSILKTVKGNETEAGWIMPWTLDLPAEMPPSGAVSPSLGTLESC